MRLDAVWSNGLSSYIAPKSIKSRSKLQIPTLGLCTIHINKFGYFDLIFKGSKIKRLSLDEYHQSRDHVKEVTGGENLI